MLDPADAPVRRREAARRHRADRHRAASRARATASPRAWKSWISSTARLTDASRRRARRTAWRCCGSARSAPPLLRCRRSIGWPILYASWVEARKTTVWWNEVGAHWMLSLDALNELARAPSRRRRRPTPSPGPTVENGLGGECEGLPAVLRRAREPARGRIPAPPSERPARRRRREPRSARRPRSGSTRIDKPDAFTPDKDCERAERVADAAPRRRCGHEGGGCASTTLEKLDRDGEDAAAVTSRRR